MTSIEEAFWTFHNANPDVYRRLVKLARDLVARGHRTIGIGMLFEVLRWHHAMTTVDTESSFKLNNNYRALYARLIMVREADLDGKFNTRRLDGHDPFDDDPTWPDVVQPGSRVDVPDADNLFAA